MGIDLGGTNIAAGLVNENCEILRKDSVPTLPGRGPEAVVADMASLVMRLVPEDFLREGGIRSVGIGSPGSVDSAAGVITFAANLGFVNLPLCEALASRLPGLPVYAENDANAAALGESLAGAASGHSSAICVTVGTGIGCGIIIGGKIYSGCNGAAGEAGHHVIVYGGKPCTCGRLGCWESYASATGLIALTKEAMETHPDSRMRQIAEQRGKVSGRTAFDAMRDGDKAGREVVELYTRYLACGLANLVNIFQPEIICLGGGISNEGENLLAPLREMTERECFKTGGTPAVLRRAVLGNDAGIIGAAMLRR